jgi:uncharacterized protein YktB (UPF0637 family)
MRTLKRWWNRAMGTFAGRFSDAALGDELQMHLARGYRRSATFPASGASAPGQRGYAKQRRQIRRY